MRVSLIRYHDRNNVNTRLPASLNKRQGVLPALGIAYIAAAVEEAGHPVQMIDAIADNLTREEVRERLQKFHPDVVGITSMTPTVLGVYEAAEVAKSTGSKTVLGGVQLAIFPRETVSHHAVDFGIMGEGEVAFVQLLEAIEGKRSLNNVEGLVYKSNRGIRVPPFPAIIPDLDVIPCPARHLLPIDKYNSIIGYAPVTTMIATRGCPYRCGFCFKTPSDKKFRNRSPKKVVDEMEYVVKQYNIREIMFYDDVFTLRRKFTVEMCEEILSRNLRVKWEAPTRVNLVDADLLKLMAQAGCVRLRYGIESGAPEILKKTAKNITLEQVHKALRDTKDAGIETFAYFIIGYIDETPETIMNTIRLACSLPLDLVMFTVATPLPDTPLHEEAIEKGFLDPDYWRDFVLGKRSDPTPYFVPNADRWARKAYNSFYLRPSYIIKSLLKIRNFDQLKKSWNAFMGIFFFEMRGSATVGT